MSDWVKRVGKVGNCIALNLRDSPFNDPRNIKEVLKKDTEVEIIDDVDVDYFEVKTPWKNTGFVLKKYIIDIKTKEKVNHGGNSNGKQHTSIDEEIT